MSKKVFGLIYDGDGKVVPCNCCGSTVPTTVYEEGGVAPLARFLLCQICYSTYFAHTDVIVNFARQGLEHASWDGIMHAAILYVDESFNMQEVTKAMEALNVRRQQP